MFARKLLLISLFSSLSWCLFGQCDYDIAFRVEGEDIIIQIKGNLSAEPVGIKVYEASSKINLIEEAVKIPVRNEIRLVGMSPGTYWIKLQWSNGCFITVGGLDGVIIVSKESKP